MGLLQQDIVNDPKYLSSFKGVTIYGVAGTNASGKDTVMDLLEEQGFLRFSTSDSLRQISRAVFNSTQRGGADTPMGRLGNAFRETYPGGMVELGLLDWWLRAGVLPEELRPKGLVIGSIRGINEAKRLKEVGGKLIVTDASPEVRFSRIAGRGRVDDHQQTYEEFMQKEHAEMAHGETDPTKFGMAAVIEMADINIFNDHNDVAGFRAQAAEVLGL
jgi:dephospho-CoA kinase